MITRMYRGNTRTERFRLLLSCILNQILIVIRSFLRRILISVAVLLITPVLLDWGLTWGAAFFAPFLDLLDFILSAMDRFPLSVGGGGSGVGPSRRPLLDLNLPPAPEPEPVPPQPLSGEEEERFRREQQAIMGSREFKKADRHLTHVENSIRTLRQRAEEIAQALGLSSQRVEAIGDAMEHLAEDVWDKSPPKKALRHSP